MVPEGPSLLLHLDLSYRFAVDEQRRRSIADGVRELAQRLDEESEFALRHACRLRGMRKPQHQGGMALDTPARPEEADALDAGVEPWLPALGADRELALKPV